MGHRTDGPIFVKFPVADPRHAKPADIDQDLTDGTQELVFLGRTDKRLAVATAAAFVESRELPLRPLAAGAPRLRQQRTPVGKSAPTFGPASANVDVGLVVPFGMNLSRDAVPQ
jgi:hypothetical protein